MAPTLQTMPEGWRIEQLRDDGPVTFEWIVESYARERPLTLQWLQSRADYVSGALYFWGGDFTVAVCGASGPIVVRRTSCRESRELPLPNKVGEFLDLLQAHGIRRTAA